jgi:hypothetical protein
MLILIFLLINNISIVFQFQNLNIINSNNMLYNFGIDITVFNNKLNSNEFIS